MYTRHLIYTMNCPIIRDMAYNYQLICEMCGKHFNGIVATQKVCGQECRKKRNIKLSGRGAFVNKDISCGTIGSIAELYVSCDLLKNGFSVFRSLSPSCFCDLLICKKDKIYRVEVRTGYISGTGKLFFSGKKHGEIDLFAVYERNLNKVYYLDNSKKEFNLFP